MIKPHPETDAMTKVEIQEAMADAEQNLKIAKEAKDKEAEVWFTQEIRMLEAALTRRNGEGSGKRVGQADLIVKAALDSGVELFHTATEDALISFDVNDHRETWPIRSKATRQWLIRGFYLLTKKAPNSEAIQTAINLLEAKARFDSEKHDVHLRTAWHDGSLFYDLCDEKWRVVQVSKSGWRIVDESPIKFIRYRHMAAQVEPDSGGNLDDLFEFINVKSETDRKLLRSWNVVGLIPDIPRPAQVLHGDQGAGKSTIAKRQRDLLDPSGMPLLRGKDETEIVQGLSHHYVAIFDNLTTVSDWLSDLLSRAVTGEGFTKRQLYTDCEDILFAYRRLLILTGIGLVVTKPDLLDRSLIIGAERIPEPLRKREPELDVQFKRAKPRLFGALLDGLAAGLTAYDHIRVDGLPRMADFAAWAMAVEAGLARKPEEWRRACDVNIGRQSEEAVTASVVATALLAFLDDHEQWAGQPHDLYALLRQTADQLKIPGKSFPGSAAVLSRRLREIRPNLATLGWKIDFDYSNRQRRITISRMNSEAIVVPDSTVAPDDESNGSNSRNPNSSNRLSKVDVDPWDSEEVEDVTG